MEEKLPYNCAIKSEKKETETKVYRVRMGHDSAVVIAKSIEEALSKSRANGYIPKEVEEIFSYVIL